jgi:uncharacterized protein DUF2784
MSPTLHAILADAILVLHFAYVAFVVVGLVLVWLGYFLGWCWVRNFWFRALHLLAMGIVVAESLLGIVCPLTVWEHDLRRLAGQDPGSEKGFIAEWVHRLMFFDLEPWVFTVIYVVFFAALVGSFIFVRPGRPRARDKRPQ